jgi:hypothetical protein
VYRDIGKPSDSLPSGVTIKDIHNVILKLRSRIVEVGRDAHRGAAVTTGQQEDDNALEALWGGQEQNEKARKGRQEG